MLQILLEVQSGVPDEAQCATADEIEALRNKKPAYAETASAGAARICATKEKARHL